MGIDEMRGAAASATALLRALAHEDRLLLCQLSVVALADLHALTRRIQALDGVVAEEVMSLATVDNVEQVAPGTISFDWLMDAPSDDSTPPHSQRHSRTH